MNRININKVMDYPIISDTLYEPLRNSFDKALGDYSNFLEMPLAPTMLATGYIGSEMSLKIEFYSSAKEMLVTTFANIALNCNEGSYLTLQHIIFNSKIVNYMKSFISEEELDEILKNICTEIYCEEDIIAVLNESKYVKVLVNILNQTFVYKDEEKFSDINNFKEFIVDSNLILFAKSFRLDGLDYLFGIPVASSLINKKLYGLFKIKYVSNCLENYLTDEDFRELYDCYNKSKGTLAIFDFKNDIGIKFEENCDLAMSFIESLELKEDIHG